MRICLFCDNRAATREHVWPDWILRQPRFQIAINQKIGSRPNVELPTPTVKVKAVCKGCNNGWMSALEGTNRSTMGAMMNDISLSLNGLDQYNLALWSVKFAMVSEFVGDKKERDLFFCQAEREQLRVASNIPPFTAIWLARHSYPNHLGFWGTDGWTDDRGIQVHVSTVLVGHLAIQTRCLKILDEKITAAPEDINTALGPKPWEDMCVKIFPNVQSANWPPVYTFNDTNDFSIMRLVRRYSYGKNLFK